MFNFFKKCECKNEDLYKTIVEAVRDSIDINKTKQRITEIIGKTLKADRCFVMEFDQKENKFKIHSDEFLSSNKLKSYVGEDLYNHVPHFLEEFKKGKSLIYNQDYLKMDGKALDINNGSYETELRTIKEYGVYSGIVFPIFYADKFLGDIVVHYVDKKHNADENEIKILKMVSNQLSIALYQANLFEQLRIQNKIQNAVLNNIPFMAWLKDENGKFIMVNRQMAENYGIEQEEFVGKDDSDFTPGLDEHYRNVDFEVMKTKKTKIVEEYIMNKGEKIWSETFKSPIIDENGRVLGTVGLAHDITDKKEAEIELLRRQEEILRYAQREKISRNIVEILRSSLDKNIIKRQFVKSIGKFFDADRVFFADYDNEAKKYLPVEDGCEYLSSINEKSLIGYDWSSPDAQEYIIHLLDKREVKISNWHEYFLKHSDMSIGMRKLFEESNVKSSYNFPVLHQTEIMGYFCIEFTKKVVELSSEEIDRVRNICTQAGIALYQTDLYVKAKKAIEAKNKFISQIVIGANNILNNIVQLSEKMAETEPLCAQHIKHSNKINENLQMLLKLVDSLNNENIKSSQDNKFLDK